MNQEQKLAIIKSFEDRLHDFLGPLEVQNMLRMLDNLLKDEMDAVVLNRAIILEEKLDAKADNYLK